MSCGTPDTSESPDAFTRCTSSSQRFQVADSKIAGSTAGDKKRGQIFSDLAHRVPGILRPFGLPQGRILSDVSALPKRSRRLRLGPQRMQTSLRTGPDRKRPDQEHWDKSRQAGHKCNSSDNLKWRRIPTEDRQIHSTVFQSCHPRRASSRRVS